MNKETKTLTNFNPIVLMYDMAELVTYGWYISQDNIPVCNLYGLWEVEMCRDEASIERVKKNINTSLIGKMDYTKEMKQVTMAAARTKRHKKEDGDAGTV